MKKRGAFWDGRTREGRSRFGVKIWFKFLVDIRILARVEKTQFFTDFIEIDLLLLKREMEHWA